jgi:hypothetical protein
MEEGFKYDSSIFPIHHDFYGFPQAPRFPFLISMNGNNNFEFSTLNFDLAQQNLKQITCNSRLEAISSLPDFLDNSRNPTNPINSRNPSDSINSTNLSREMRSLFHWDPMNPTNSSNPSAAPQHDVTPHSAFFNSVLSPHHS